MKSDSKSKPLSPPDYFADHYKKLVGKTVKGVAVDSRGGPDYALVFTDGTAAWIMCDPEGNGPGFLDIQPPTKGEQK